MYAVLLSRPNLSRQDQKVQDQDHSFQDQDQDLSSSNKVNATTKR